MGINSHAQTALVRGVVLDKKNNPIEGVNIICSNNLTQTNSNGQYKIDIPANEKTTIEFTHISLKKASIKILLKPNEVYVLNIFMDNQEEQMGEVIVNANNKKTVQGIQTFEAKDIRFIPGANAGIENVLKTLPGVNSNNELSTQYSVRGGNYDENLVYVNEIEVYRPFLIRSGQQEGLSFINTDLVQNIDFSAGGFQAKYGDKMSSVLDITYRNPSQFGASLELSFLGGSFAFDVISKDKKWSAITGIRYRNNSLLVNSQDTQTNYTPTFADIQTNITYQASAKWQWSFLGNISQNHYLYEPLTRQTNFGTINEPMALAVYYQGKEKDIYKTYFGAIKTTYQLNESTSLKLIGSLFHTIEQEYFDIYAQYRLGEVDTNIGSDSYDDIQYTRGIGSQLNHARNDLDALIGNLELKGLKNWKQNQIEWGIKYTKESIHDRISEWEMIDSAGFSIRPPVILPKNDQPYQPYSGLLIPYQFVRATNFTDINRISAYTQWSRKGNIGSNEIWYNVGVRLQSWEVSGTNLNGKVQTIFNPRGQFALKPDWEKEILFRFTIGLYGQPPFYRELRDYDGIVQPDVKAQKSLNIVFGSDYSFEMWKRPFKLTTEAYYKKMTDVNPYTIDNVRIRYLAQNNAVAYAQGLDVRLNGEFVPGTDSWISFGYLKTEENWDHKEYIARPTDQRLKFGLLFQDYMPKIPSLKLYLNLVYNTGLPGGSPSYADPYLYQNRLNDYRRADIGFSKVFIDQKVGMSTRSFFKNFKELSLGFEIFNLFNNQNAITNTWVRDVYTKTEYAIPNYMTKRVFNLKLNARL
ncbi:TonB-dependent receptor [Flavobacterium adhaerens]|uniref:TonB-dependent receptor n=1 Tax=Flavobacterium adhaerens TaxID=3149043 RepID=UPI0032B611CB